MTRIGAFGIALIGLALLSGMDAVIKHLTGQFPIWQIVFLRYLLGLGFTGPFAIGQLRQGIGRTGWNHGILRGCLAVLTAVLFFFALKLLPLVVATALAFTAPFWSCLFSYLFLKEQIARQTILAIILGYGGVLVLVDWGTVIAFSANALGLAAALMAAITYALGNVLIQTRSKFESPATQMTVQTAVSVICAAPFALANWSPVSTEAWIVFAVVGALGAVGRWATALSLSLGRVSDLAAAEFSSIFWAFLFGTMFFGETPVMRELIGVVLVVMGCAVYRRHGRSIRISSNVKAMPTHTAAALGNKAQKNSGSVANSREG